MRISTSLLTASIAFLLAACSAGSDGTGADTGDAGAGGDAGSDTGGEQSGGPVAVAGTAWLTVGTDGAVQTTFLDAGGRYRDFRNGEPLFEGTWEQRPEGSVCFQPDNGVGACWELGRPESDGTLIATNGEDRRIEIKRITYTAPPSDDETGG